MRSVLVVAILAGTAFTGGADQAAALLKRGDAKRAAASARKLVDRDAANIDAWIVLSDALITLSEPEDAWTALETAIEKNPEDARLALKLGDVFLRMAEKEQRGGNDGTAITNYLLDAERMYDEALSHDPKSADAIYGKAYANVQLGRNEKAKKFIRECLGLQQNHAKCLALQASVFYGEKKYAEAQRLYEIALKLDDSDPTNMLRYGHCFFAQGKKKEAKAAYIAVLKRHPKDLVAIVSGLYYIAGKNWRKMAPLLREAAAAAPKSAPTFYYLGYSEFINNNFDAAVSAFRSARKLDPADAEFTFYLGYALEKQGKAKAALDSYRKSLKLNPDHEAAAGRFEGIVRMQGDIEAVERLYEELIKLAPSYGWGMNNYGLVLRDWSEKRGASQQANPPAAVRRRIKRSGQVYEMAAAILTKEPQIQSDTGLLFEFYPCNRDDEKAEKYFTEALVISEWTYRDAFSGIVRLCNRTKNWTLLKEHAEGVVGALEGRGLQAVAPVGGGEPRQLKNETPGMLARAKAAIRVAARHLGGKAGDE